MAKHIFLVFVEVIRSADMQIMHILITKIAFKPNLTKLGWHGPCVVPVITNDRHKVMAKRHMALIKPQKLINFYLVLMNVKQL
jgi:hypothetical protein